MSPSVHLTIQILSIISLFIICEGSRDNVSNSTKVPGYIIAECDEGLANRLRVLLAHLYFAKRFHDDAHLVMIWDVNDACPGHFLQLFHPLKKVTFATNTSKAILSKNAMKVYDSTSNGLIQAAAINNMHIPSRELKTVEYDYLKRLKPLPSILAEVAKFNEQHHLCNMAAIHVRKSDLERHMHHMRRTNIRKFYEFVDSRPATEKVLLLTDDVDTQTAFRRKYGPRLVFYSNMSDPTNVQYTRRINDTYFSLSRAAPPSDNLQEGVGADPLNPLQSNEYRPGFPVGEARQAYDAYIAGLKSIETALRSRPVDEAAIYIVGREPSAIGEKTVPALLLPDKHRSSPLTATLVDILLAARSGHFRGSAFSSLSELVQKLQHLHRRHWCASKGAIGGLAGDKGDLSTSI